MYSAYVYRTSDPRICVVVPLDASIEVYAASMSSFLSASDFNLTSTASAKTRREMRAAASSAGVRLKKVKLCARVSDHSKIHAVEP